VTFDEWEAGASEALKADRMWRMRAYRLACYLGDVGWSDAKALASEPLTADVAAQLFRALGSIRANLAEGYSRSGGRDRARLFEYALGSAREAREWYRHAAPMLGAHTTQSRTALLDQISRMLITAIPRERQRRIAPASTGATP
jgi:four helix bundle protein